MIKKQQKWIALLVTLTFVWLLQVSAMPLGAVNAPDQAQLSSTHAEQGPRFIEEEGEGGYKAEKKSALPIILIGLGVAAVVAVLVLVVFKTSYDITGEWNYSWKNTADANWRATGQKIVFAGDKKTGTVAYMGTTGSYTVDGKNVTVIFVIANNWHVTHTGTFDGKDKITGNWKRDEIANITGSFELTRVAASAHTRAPQNQQEIPGQAADK